MEPEPNPDDLLMLGFPPDVALPEECVASVAQMLGACEMLKRRYAPSESAHRVGKQLEVAVMHLWRYMLEHCLPAAEATARPSLGPRPVDSEPGGA
jgi:hypothetical protein